MRISVVIPVRDGERYLGEALASVAAQSHPAHEVLVVDDGSSDASPQIAAAAPGVTLIRRGPEGPAAARNAGARAAAGDALAFLDADDLAAPRRLELQARALAGDPELVAVAGRMQQFLSPDREAELQGRFAVSPEPALSFTAGTLLIRRDAFLASGGLDHSLTGGEVIDWVHRLRSTGRPIATIDDVVVHRRIHGDNLTLRRDALHAGYLATARAAIERRRSQASG